MHRRYLVVQNYVSNGEDPSLWVWDANQTPDPRWEKSDGTAIDHGVTNDQNIIVELTYDLLGRRTSLRDPRGNVTQYEYDQLGRRIKLTNPLNREWVTEYEDVKVSGAFTGETLVRLTDPRNYETERKTDRLGRLTSIGYGDPANTYDVVFTYDAAGNRTLMTEYSDTAHQTEARITQFSYDSARRLVNVGFDHDGDASIDETVSYEYDLSGHRTKLTLPGNLDITYVYDQKGQLISLTDWDGHETQFAYDNANRLIAAERANDLRSRYIYDSAGRLRLLRHTQGRKTLAHFAYEVDGRGNRTQALELLAHPMTTDDVTYTYDDVSIVYQGDWTDDASTYKKSETFSASLKLAFFGQSASFTVATGVNHSLFDVYINGSLWQSFDGYAAASGERTIDIDLTSDGPHLFEIRNRAEHSLAAKADSNYDEHTFIVRFKQLTVPDMAYDLRTLEYTYDALSRLTETRVNPGIHTGAADVDLLRRSQHIYDVAGNRLSESVAVNGGSPTVTTYTYTATNQIANAGFTYDANGNVINDGTNTYTWDRANRLTSMGGISYAYDGLSNRISQTANSIATQYLLDLQPGLPLTLARTMSGNTERFVFDAQGHIHARQDANDNWQWMLRDGLNSGRVVVDDMATVNGVQSYTDYGTPVDSVGTFGFPFMYTGEMMDANALVYLRARYYHPGLGVFMSLDPVEGVNRYQYVGGNVANMVDPSGLQAGKNGCNFRCFGEDTIEVGAGATLDCIAGVIYQDSDYDFFTVERRVQEQNRVIAPHLADPTIPINPTGQANYFLFLPPELTYCHLEPVSDCVESKITNEIFSKEALCSFEYAAMGVPENPDQTWINCFNKCQTDRVLVSGTPSTICDALVCRKGCDNFVGFATQSDWLRFDVTCQFTRADIAGITLNALGLIPGMGLAASSANCAIQVGSVVLDLIRQGMPKVEIEQTLYEISLEITPGDVDISSSDMVGSTSSCLNLLYNVAGKEVPVLGEAWAIVDSMYIVYNACNQ